MKGEQGLELDNKEIILPNPIKEIKIKLQKIKQFRAINLSKSIIIHNIDKMFNRIENGEVEVRSKKTGKLLDRAIL